MRMPDCLVYERGERPPAKDFPPRLDAVPELDTRGALTRLWDHLKKGQKQRLVADAIAESTSSPARRKDIRTRLRLACNGHPVKY